MWEFLQDWFNQIEHQLRMQMDRISSRAQSNSPRMSSRQPSSAAGMADNLMGDATRPPDGFDRLWGKLNQLTSLHSDEYKASHPELDRPASGPQHVIVDNADAINGEGEHSQPGSQPPGGGDRLNQLMERLKGMHSSEYRASHPWDFRTPGQGSGFRMPSMSRLTEWLGGSRKAGRNRLTRMRMWGRRLRRKFSMNPQTRARVGGWMVHGGRALQMGAGRLSAIGGPTAQYLASGMARAGMALEGGGGALAAGGVAVGGAALAGGAIVGAVAAAGVFVVATKKMGEALIDSQRGLAQWNGSIAMSIAQTDIHRMRLDSRQAAATSDNVAELNDAMRRLRESTQGLREGFANLGLKLATWAVEGASAVMEAKEGISNGIADYFAWLMGVGQELAEERQGRVDAQQRVDVNGPGRQFFDALGNQHGVPRPPLRPIP